MSKNAHRLQGFIARAIEQNMCAHIHRTTCGAEVFRRGLRSTVGGQSKVDMEPMFGAARALADLMVGLVKKEGYTYVHENPVRLMLFEIWPFVGKEDGEDELDSLLRGTWVGEVLARMKTHFAAVRETRHDHEERQPSAPRRREEKWRQKAEQHALRLAVKAERDRLWHEKQKGKS
jgi:hypothetical protein